MFIFIIVGLLVFSFLLALFSLWRDLKKNIKTEQVSEELSKGRVVFHAPTAIQEMPVHHDQLTTDAPENAVENVPNLSENPLSPPTFHHENLTPEIAKEHTDLPTYSSSSQELPNSDIITPHISSQIRQEMKVVGPASLEDHPLSAEDTSKKIS